MSAAKHNTGTGFGATAGGGARGSLFASKRRLMALALIGGGALLLVAAVVGILVFFSTPKTPPPAALQAAVAEKLAAIYGGRYTIAAFNPSPPENANSADGAFRYGYSATLAIRLADTLYEQVPAVDYIQNQMRLDTSAERKIEQILAGPGGARIRELAGLDDASDTLATTQLVRETARAGARYEIRATLTARRDTASPATGGWRVDVTALTSQTPLPGGEPLARLTGRRLLDITRESDLATIRRLVAQSNDALRRVEQARDRYNAALAAGIGRVTDTYLALLAPGTLFTGTATLPRPRAAVIGMSLEIKTLNRDAARITALLRTDNSWNDARLLEGSCAYDIATNALILNLTAPAGPALISASGDVLSDGNVHLVQMRFSGAELIGVSPASAPAPGAKPAAGFAIGWACRLARVPDSARDATLATLNANARKLADATRPGAVYRVQLGANAGANLQIPAEMLLRITASNPATRALAATLEDTASDWTRDLRGEADDNIFRAAGHPIRLASADAADNAAANTAPPIALNLHFSATDARVLEGTLQPLASAAAPSLPFAIPDSPTNGEIAVTLTPAGKQYLAQVAAQKSEILRQAAEQARLDHLATHPDLDTLPPADGAYLWRAGTWLPLPRNGARVVHSTLQKIGGFFGAALSLVKTRSDKQDTGTLTFEGSVPPPATAAAQVIILAYRGPMKTYAGTDTPAGRIPIEIAPLEIKNNGRLRTAELTRLGDSAATFGATAIDSTVERPETPAAAGNIYLVRVTRTLSPGRYALAAPDQPFEFEVR